MSEASINETPKSLDEYSPLLLSKDDLVKLTTLVFNVDPNKLSGQDLAERLLEDRDLVRAKYDLPKQGLLADQPAEYYRNLETMAKRTGVSIRPKEAYSAFFKENFATAVHFSDRNEIGVHTIRDSDSKKEVFNKAVDLEHELIHAIQNKRYTSMPLLRKEYEAYIASANPNILQTKPLFFMETMAWSLTPKQLNAAWQDSPYSQKPI